MSIQRNAAAQPAWAQPHSEAQPAARVTSEHGTPVTPRKPAAATLGSVRGRASTSVARLHVDPVGLDGLAHGREEPVPDAQFGSGKRG